MPAARRVGPGSASRTAWWLCWDHGAEAARITAKRYTWPGFECGDRIH